MALTRSINSRFDFCVFAETEKGFFGYANDTGVKSNNTCSESTMDIYAIDKNGAAYVPQRWYGAFLTDVAYSKVTATGGTSAHEIYPSVRQSQTGTSLYKITVVDEHGTHYGLKSGSTNPPKEGYSTGVMHKSTDEGYTFIGWKVTIPVRSALASQPTIVSDGGTTEGEVTTFSDGYEGAVIITAGNELSVNGITIEALYEKLSVTRTITLDPNGGTVSQTSVECTGTYENAVAITPTLEGKTFAGWYDSAEDGERIYASTPLTEDSAGTLYAHWEDEPEPPGPGPDPSSRSGLMVRSSTSDYLVFSAPTGDLVYAR